MAPRVPGHGGQAAGWLCGKALEDSLDRVLLGLAVEENHLGVAGRTRGAEDNEQSSQDLHDRHRDGCT